MAPDSHLVPNLNHLFDNFELLPLVQEGRDLHLVHARLACPGTPRDKFKFKITINSSRRKKNTGQLFQRNYFVIFPDPNQQERMEGSSAKPSQVIFKTGEDEHSISGFAFPADFKSKAVRETASSLKRGGVHPKLLLVRPKAKELGQKEMPNLKLEL